MNGNSSNKVSVFYGRARRIEFVERVAYMIIAIVAIVLVVMLVFSQSSNSDRNVNFSFLREHLESRGFKCEMIHLTGGQCSLSTEQSLVSFVRYEDGFEYIYKTDSYLLDIKHTLDDKNIIIFKTTSDAFVGYRNKEYTCETEKSVIDGLKSCKDKDGNNLDNNSYIGIIEQSMKDINIIIENSGYYKDELLDNNEWIKK